LDLRSHTFKGRRGKGMGWERIERERTEVRGRGREGRVVLKTILCSEYA